MRALERERGKNTFSDTPVGQIVSKDLRTAGIFSRYGIDFCCHGSKILSHVCREKGLDLDRVVRDLSEIIVAGPSSGTNRFTEWPADFLVDYILQNHHAFLKRTMPAIEEGLRKIERVHGERHSELPSVREVFHFMHQSLRQHMWKEENVLFPYIKHLARCGSQTDNPAAPFLSVTSPVRAMMAEHEREGENLAKLRALTGDFQPPPDGCATYRLVYAELKEFQDDLFQHIHLENNILFPEAVRLEEKRGLPQFEPGKVRSTGSGVS